MKHDNASRILHSQTRFTPAKAKSDKPGKTILVALGSCGIAVVVAVISSSVQAFVPAWAVFFLLGWGAFAEGR